MPSSTLSVASYSLATARSWMPSPLKSPTTTEEGPYPTGYAGVHVNCAPPAPVNRVAAWTGALAIERGTLVGSSTMDTMATTPSSLQVRRAHIAVSLRAYPGPLGSGPGRAPRRYGPESLVLIALLRIL